MELESGGLGVRGQEFELEFRVGEWSWRAKLAARAKVRGRRADWRPRACLRARRDFDYSVKGAREGARVKIMSVGCPQTAGRASRSGAGLCIAFGRRQQAG